LKECLTFTSSFIPFRGRMNSLLKGMPNSSSYDDLDGMTWVSSAVSFGYMIVFRFRELGERINRYGLSTPSVLSPLRGGPPVQQVAVGPAHIAFLFEDGRVARVAFSVISDRLDLNRNENAKA